MSQFTLHNCPLIYFKINWSLRLPIPEFSGSYCILILKTSSFTILKKIMFSRKCFLAVAMLVFCGVYASNMLGLKDWI